MVDPAIVKPALDRLLERFDKSFLEPDPLAAVIHFSDPDDMETACLIAALFAYGRADLIQKNVSQIVRSMGDSPARFCEEFSRSTHRSWQKSFVYRFHRRPDLTALVTAIGKTRQRHGSLRQLFMEKDDPSDPSILPGLAGMAHTLRSYAPKGDRFFKTLLANPLAGGASKRWALYLRWMIRKDKVDPGPWNKYISPARLVIPLDTHVGRIARLIGILNRKSDDWKAVMELTGFLKQLDPVDPIKYDFAICSYGKLGYCVRRPVVELCGKCDISSICSYYKNN